MLILKNFFKLNRLPCFLVIIGVFFCNACAADAEAHPKSGESVSALAIHDPNPKPPPDSVQRHDLRNESLNQWTRYEIVSENSIRVFFSTGTKSCYGNRAILAEMPQEIQIAVVEGSIPEAPEACIAVGLLTSFLLQTKNPIAGRKIVPLQDVELKK